MPVKNQISDWAREYSEKLFRYFQRVFPPGLHADWDYLADLSRHVLELANREYVDLEEVDELLTLAKLSRNRGSGEYELELLLSSWLDSLLAENK